jgi:CBS domain-containing protein
MATTDLIYVNATCLQGRQTSPSEIEGRFLGPLFRGEMERSMLDEAKFVASDIMTRDVAVVHPETTLLAAVKLMASCRISGLPVVDEQGHLVGMMSEGDLLRWHEGFSQREARWLDLLSEGFELAPDFLQELQEQHRKIKALMSPKPITVTEATPAREIASLMHAHGIKRVPVLRGGKLVGIVTRTDLVRALAQKLGEMEPPPPRPITVDEALRQGRAEAIADVRKARPRPLITSAADTADPDQGAPDRLAT